MKRLLRAALAGFLASLLVACAEVGEPIRIGSLDFTEQKLLAEMMALLAEQAGVDVKRAIPYGNNRKSLEAIQRGVIDAYPAYDGTLLVLSGRPALRDPAAATPRRGNWWSRSACAGSNPLAWKTVSRSRSGATWPSAVA